MRGLRFGVALLVLAAPVLAQTRPTLSEQDSRLDAVEPIVDGHETQLDGHEARIDALEAYVCGSADDPRPLLCAGDCTCNTTAPYAAGTTCTETAPGTFEVSESFPYSAGCVGICVEGSFSSCTPSCPAGEVCGAWLEGATACIEPVHTCTSDAQCSTGCAFDDSHPLVSATGTCVLGAGCLTDADCLATGFTCEALVLPDGNSTNVCTNGTCSSEGTCASGTLPPQIVFSISNVGPAGSSTLATCTFEGLQVNSNDAQACLAEVESELGASCTPLP